MLKFSKIVIDTGMTVGENFLFASCRPAYEYEHGVQTTRIRGYRCRIILLDRDCAEIDVLVPSEPDIPSGTPVRLTDLELHLYSINGKAGLTAKATSIAPVGR